MDAVERSSESGPRLVGQRHVPAALNVMRVLDFVAAHGESRAVTIATELDLNASTCHDTLKTLVDGGYLSYSIESKHYEVGPCMIAAGAAAFRKDDLVLRARPRMRDWVNQTRLTIFLARPLPDFSSVVIDKVESTLEIRLTVGFGQRFPPAAAVIGKIILAHSGLNSRSMSGILEQFSPRSIVDIDTWEVELERVRSQGWSESRGEYYGGGNAVAAPIFDHTGGVLAVLGSLAAPSDLPDGELAQFGAAIKDSARAIQESLFPG